MLSFDTNVLIRALSRSRAPARRIFAELLKGAHRLVLSNEIIVEVTKVLRYPDQTIPCGNVSAVEIYGRAQVEKAG